MIVVVIILATYIPPRQYLGIVFMPQSATDSELLEFIGKPIRGNPESNYKRFKSVLFSQIGWMIHDS